MKYRPLLWAAVFRNPAETILTWLAATLGFCLFSLMAGLHVHIQELISQQRMERLYVVMRYPDHPFTGLPVALGAQIARIRHVTGVGTVHWLNGYHVEPRDGASVMAVDEGTPKAKPELGSRSLTERAMPFAIKASGNPSRVLVLSTHALNEHGADLDPASVATILDAPGIALGPDGKPAVDAEVLINAPPAAGFVQGSLNVRGISPNGLALRPEVRLTTGRMFRPGHHELIAGVGTARVFHMTMGDTLVMPDGPWPIVGTYSGGGALESQLLTDASTLMTELRRTGYGSLLVELADPAGYEAFKRWLTTNPALEVTAERQADYYIRNGWSYSFYQTMAYFVAALMSVGALFGAVNILYSAVRSRTREIAILRAIGYAPLPLSVSVMIEAILLSLSGALTGALLAWLLFDGHESISGVVFRWSVSPELMALGISWALALAVLGSLFPALRAARLPVSAALHE